MARTALDLVAEANALIPGGVNSATRNIGAPHAFKTARGAYLTDYDGNKYVDYHAAFGAIILGHSHPAVEEAVRNSMGELDLVGLGVSELEVEVARLTAEMIPSVEMSVNTMSGTEATLQTVRLARAITDRRYMLKFQGCFHGWHDAVARNVISAAEKVGKVDPTSEIGRAHV